MSAHLGKHGLDIWVWVNIELLVLLQIILDLSSVPRNNTSVVLLTDLEDRFRFELVRFKSLAGLQELLE